jgi:hypothetical protein
VGIGAGGGGGRKGSRGGRRGWGFREGKGLEEGWGKRQASLSWCPFPPSACGAMPFGGPTLCLCRLALPSPSLPLLLSSLSLGGTCVGIVLGHLGFAMDKSRV